MLGKTLFMERKTISSITPMVIDKLAAVLRFKPADYRSHIDITIDNSDPTASAKIAIKPVGDQFPKDTSTLANILCKLPGVYAEDRSSKLIVCSSNSTKVKWVIGRSDENGTKKTPGSAPPEKEEGAPSEAEEGVDAQEQHTDTVPVHENNGEFEALFVSFQKAVEKKIKNEKEAQEMAKEDMQAILDSAGELLKTKPAPPPPPTPYPQRIAQFLSNYIKEEGMVMYSIKKGLLSENEDMTFSPVDKDALVALLQAGLEKAYNIKKRGPRSKHTV